MSKPLPSKSIPTWRNRGSASRALACGLALGLATLAACSDEQARRENSELRVDPPVASAPAAPAAAPVPNQPTGPLPGVGRRYRVKAETAYFFDQPEQSTPNGRYLRRGDTFFGEGETNGFVKTSFVQPNGVAGTAWLKTQALSQLAGSSTRPTAPARPAAPPAYVPNDAAGATRELGNASGSQTAVVQVDRSYFYNSPDLAQPRKAFCQRGDKVRLGEVRGEAVYVTFTNWEKVTTTGWMRRDALR